MSRHPRYWLYRVGRGPKTDERQRPITLRLPDLGDPAGLSEEFRYLARPHVFEPPEEHGRSTRKTLPLTDEEAADLERRGWLVAKHGGDGEPRLPSEKKMLAAVTARRDEVLSARGPVYQLLDPHGDYADANLVCTYLAPGKTKKYRIEELPEAQLPFEGGYEQLPIMIDSLKELQRKLRKKGWSFRADGSAREPSTGGRRQQFPRDLIRRAYDSLAAQYEHSGRGEGIMSYLQEVLRPHVGELTLEEIEAALRNHLRT